FNEQPLSHPALSASRLTQPRPRDVRAGGLAYADSAACSGEEGTGDMVGRGDHDIAVFQFCEQRTRATSVAAQPVQVIDDDRVTRTNHTQ
ncbi:MAG: hypothetical protein Q7T17_03895, partial [Microbacterium sp.]|nr:hypothetical protein [Microbacterium sp.]